MLGRAAPIMAQAPARFCAVPEEDSHVSDTPTQKFALFQGQIVPLEQAKVSVMTHAFNYGTGVFEGIRGYWNEEREEVYIVFLREHYTRFLRNTRMVCIEIPYSLDELVDRKS